MVPMLTRRLTNDLVNCQLPPEAAASVAIHLPVVGREAVVLALLKRDVDAAILPGSHARKRSRVAHVPGDAGRGLRLVPALAEQALEVEPPREHRQPALGRAGPRRLGPVPVELDPVLVRVAQVERLADAVVAGAVERDAGGDQPAQGVGQRRAGRIEDGEVVEPGGARRRRRPPRLSQVLRPMWWW